MQADPKLFASPVHIYIYMQADPKLFASQVRAEIGAALGVPLTTNTQEDVKLCALAQKMHVPLVHATVGMKKVMQDFDVDYSSVEDRLKEFAAMDADNSGTVDWEEYCKAKGIVKGSAEEDEVHQLFDLLDEDESHTLDFKEFLLGMLKHNEKVKGVSRRVLDFSQYSEAQLKTYMDTLFAVGDRKCTGALDKEELKLLVGWSGFEFDTGLVDELMAKCKKKGDGMIGRGEFVAMMVQQCKAKGNIADGSGSVNAEEEEDEEEGLMRTVT